MISLTIEQAGVVVSIIVALLALGLSYGQMREAARSYRATLLAHLIQEWSDSELYSAVAYIHHLRREWKVEKPNGEWQQLADQWVQDNAPDGASAPTEEWCKRRRVSQFISKMGYLMDQRYISDKDFFGIVAEAGRILLILDPIERAIANHYGRQEQSMREWDHPFLKISLDRVRAAYSTWFQREGKSLLLSDNCSLPAQRPIIPAARKESNGKESPDVFVREAEQ